MFVFLHFRSFILKTIIVEVLRIKFDSSPTLSNWNILQNYSRSKHMRWSPKQQRQQKHWSFRKLDEWWDDVPVQQKQDFHAIRKYEGKNNSKGWFFLDLLGGQKNNCFDLNTDKFSWMMGFVLWVLVWCDLAEYSFLLCVFFLAFCFPLFLWLTLFSHRWPNKVLEKTLWSSGCVLIGLKMLNITTRLVFRAVLRTISLLRIMRNKHRLCWQTNPFLNTTSGVEGNTVDETFWHFSWMLSVWSSIFMFTFYELFEAVIKYFCLFLSFSLQTLPPTKKKTDCEVVRERMKYFRKQWKTWFENAVFWVTLIFQEHRARKSSCVWVKKSRKGLNKWVFFVFVCWCFLQDKTGQCVRIFLLQESFSPNKTKLKKLKYHPIIKEKRKIVYVSCICEWVKKQLLLL